MPQIIIKGATPGTVAHISAPLTKELGRIMDTPEDWFSVEYLPTRFFFGGVEISHDPIVEVKWFDRGQPVQDAAAKAIDTLLRAEGYQQIEIHFTPLSKPAYYENGEHY